MYGSFHICANTSIKAPRLLPSDGTRNTALPPLPCKGLMTRSPLRPSATMRAWNARTSSIRRATSVGGMNRAKSSTNTFSGASRTLRGSLTTKVRPSSFSSKCAPVI